MHIIKNPVETVAGRISCEVLIGEKWRELVMSTDAEYEIHESSDWVEVKPCPQSEKDAHALSEARAKFKAERAIAVAALTITTEAGNVFDADETSQGRMARAVVAMEAGDVIQWVLSDNSIVDVDASELKEALKLAGTAQSALWS